MYKSPKLYIPCRDVVDYSMFDNISVCDITAKDMKSSFTEIDNNVSIVLDNKKVYNANYIVVDNKEFAYDNKYNKIRDNLCNIELFNLQEKKFDIKTINNRFTKIGNIDLHNLYTSKLYGNDLTYFRYIINKEDKYSNEEEFKDILYSDNKYILNNTPYKTYNINRSTNTITSTVHPLMFATVDKKNYRCFYRNDIQKIDTRYCVIPVINLLTTQNKKDKTQNIKYDKKTHAQVIFIDTEKKVIDFYDPDSHRLNSKSVRFIYWCLKKLFGKEYKITKFWDYVGIQVVEEYIKEDDVGFCGTWVSIMVRLKLVNWEYDCNHITEYLIEKCRSMNISLYELMVNYSFMFDRILDNVEFKNALRR